MASEGLEEGKNSDDGSHEAEDLEEEVTAGGGEEGKGENETPKRGRKRESPEKAEEEETVEKKQRRRRRSGASEGASSVERPSRERKAVERYSALSPRKVSASKALSIEQGSGTKIKDIPNAFFKLSKRKIDENLQHLHTILFGRKPNAYFLKRNIFQFSGFVWSENEEKQRAKVKEKLDKCTKDKLLDFCDLLDIHVQRATTRKEEISAKLLEFLESPHVTRDVLLAEKDKKVKKRRRTKGISQRASGETSSDRETKKHKSPETEGKNGRRQSAKAEEEEEEEEEGGSTDTKDASNDEEDNEDSEAESEHAKTEEENEENEPEESDASKKVSDERQREKGAELKIKEKASPVKKGSSAKSKSPSKPVSKKASLTAEDEPKVADNSKQGSSKEPTKKGSKAIIKEKAAPVRKEGIKKSSTKSASVDGSDSGPPSFSKSKRQDKKKGKSNEKLATQDKKASKKREAKSGSKGSAKEQGKGKANAGPSREELHTVVSNILKEVDFNTATLADILKQLGAHFDMDLMDRKAEVKLIIEDVINNMTDDEDGEEDEDDDDDEGGGNSKEEE